MTAPADAVPLPRCCEQHTDWRTLAEHLVADFSDLPMGDVVRELSRAKEAVESFGLDELDQIGVAELMARHQLMMLTGSMPDIARLDPERHVRIGRESASQSASQRET
jgi:hypothetical protein